MSRLFNYGIGIHLIQSENPENMPEIGHINPKANHISFQCECMATVEMKLQEMRIEYVKGSVEEGGIQVDQLFFHDPDGTMIEVCNCENLPVIPLPRSDNAMQRCRSLINCNIRQMQQDQQQNIEQAVKNLVT